MITVYLDSQLFRYIKNSEKFPEQQKLLYENVKNYIERSRNDLQYFFSYAHLLDLQNDKTEKKHEDLNFMETIVQDNFIISFSNGEIGFLLLKPNKAFETYIDDDETNLEIDFNDLFDPEKHIEYLDDTKYHQLKTQTAILKNLTVGDIIPDMHEIPVGQAEIINKIFPFNNPSLSVIDYLNHIVKFTKEFQTDNSVYKELRNIVTETKDVKFTVDLSTFDFTMSYKDTLIQKNFIDFLKEQIKKKDYTQFDLHYQAYISLDLFGVEKEKSSKLKTDNLLNDAQHSFYAANCDVLVSDDVQLREKSKIIYKLFGIETKVLSIHEFISEVFLFNLQIDYREANFWDKIISVLNNNFITRAFKPYPDRDVVIYNTREYFLSYFNELRIIKEQRDKYLVLRHSVSNYNSNLANYKIIKAVTNKAIDLFGLDGFGNGYFNYEAESKQIEDNNWQGRTWRKDKIEVILEINLSTYMLNLVICL